MHYCDFCASKPTDDINRMYHDHHYGVPIHDDNELFGRLVLEINQAGLSWVTILKKEHNFRNAFDEFTIERIARYDEHKKEALMQDAGIIRNKLKIQAAIHNAQQVMRLKEEFGSFKQWLDGNNPKTLDEWTKLFKKTFTFVGGEIVNEFLMSTGYLPGAHKETCYRYTELKQTK